jgi:hypothetical protein
MFSISVSSLAISFFRLHDPALGSLSGFMLRLRGTMGLWLVKGVFGFVNHVKT